MSAKDLLTSPAPNHPHGKFDWGDIGMYPATNDWGFSRGEPVDRYYIEKFLDRHSYDIRGRVLEVGGNSYTRRYGGERVSQSDILDIAKYHEGVTIIADLNQEINVQSEIFDCIILTQVLVLIREAPKALQTMHRILKPGGVVLITVPGISQISSFSNEADHWFWSFYPNSLRLLLERADFDSAKLLVEGWGNFKTTVGFLAGLAQQDLLATDFDLHDSRYPLIVTARAVKRQVA